MVVKNTVLVDGQVAHLPVVADAGAEGWLSLIVWWPLSRSSTALPGTDEVS